MGPSRSNIYSENIGKMYRKFHWLPAWQELIEHVCNQSGSISNKRHGHLDSCAENPCNLRSCRVIT